MDDQPKPEPKPKPAEPPPRQVGPEDEERKSPTGPGSQMVPEVEPSGS